MSRFSSWLLERPRCRGASLNCLIIFELFYKNECRFQFWLNLNLSCIWLQLEMEIGTDMNLNLDVNSMLPWSCSRPWRSCRARGCRGTAGDRWPSRGRPCRTASGSSASVSGSSVVPSQGVAPSVSGAESPACATGTPACLSAWVAVPPAGDGCCGPWGSAAGISSPPPGVCAGTPGRSGSPRRRRSRCRCFLWRNLVATKYERIACLHL